MGVPLRLLAPRQAARLREVLRHRGVLFARSRAGGTATAATETLCECTVPALVEHRIRPALFLARYFVCVLYGAHVARQYGAWAAEMRAACLAGLRKYAAAGRDGGCSGEETRRRIAEAQRVLDVAGVYIAAGWTPATSLLPGCDDLLRAAPQTPFPFPSPPP